MDYTQLAMTLYELSCLEMFIYYVFIYYYFIPITPLSIYATFFYIRVKYKLSNNTGYSPS